MGNQQGTAKAPTQTRRFWTHVFGPVPNNLNQLPAPNRPILAPCVPHPHARTHNPRSSPRSERCTDHASNDPSAASVAQPYASSSARDSANNFCKSGNTCAGSSPTSSSSSPRPSPSPRANTSTSPNTARWTAGSVPPELLTRRLILAAALSINVVLQPTSSREYKPRRRRRVLIWPKNPSSWIVRLRMFPRKPPEMPPLRRARREQPRVLADPDKRAHRIAVKLARIAARNAKANEPASLAPARGTPNACSTAASASSVPAWSLSCR